MNIIIYILAAIGCMTISCCIARSLHNTINQTPKEESDSFRVKFLFAVYIIFTALSLFVGLFFELYENHKESTIRHVVEQEYEEKYKQLLNANSELSCENFRLKADLYELQQKLDHR